MKVIEDATEGLGATYKGRSARLSRRHVACFSFNGNKIITTGGGGMLVTDNEEWARKAKYLTTQAKDDPVEYVHGEVGYNYRLTNLLAAVGCAQMEHLAAYVAAKRKIAARYTEELQRRAGLRADEKCSLGCQHLLDVYHPGRRGEVRDGLTPIDARLDSQEDPMPPALAADSSVSCPCFEIMRWRCRSPNDWLGRA